MVLPSQFAPNYCKTLQFIFDLLFAFSLLMSHLFFFCCLQMTDSQRHTNYTTLLQSLWNFFGVISWLYMCCHLISDIKCLSSRLTICKNCNLNEMTRNKKKITTTDTTDINIIIEIYMSERRKKTEKKSYTFGIGKNSRFRAQHWNIKSCYQKLPCDDILWSLFDISLYLSFKVATFCLSWEMSIR